MKFFYLEVYSFFLAILKVFFLNTRGQKNKLPDKTISQKFTLEYGKATIEVHKRSVKKNDKILIVDDLIATGGTALAAAKLIEKCKGKVAGYIFLINLFDLPGNEKLEKKDYKSFSLIKFPGH